MKIRNYSKSRYSHGKNKQILALLKKVHPWYAYIKFIIAGVAVTSFVIPIIVDIVRLVMEGGIISYESGTSVPRNWLEELDRQIYYFLSSFSSFNHLARSSTFKIEFSLRTLCHAFVFCALSTSICGVSCLLHKLLRPRSIIRSIAYETEETEAWHKMAQQDKGVNKLVYKNKNIAAIIDNINKTLICLFDEYIQNVENIEDSAEKVLLRGEKYDRRETYETLVQTLRDEYYLLWHWLGVKPHCETGLTPSKRSIFTKTQIAVEKQLPHEDAYEIDEHLHELVSEYTEHSLMLDLYEIERFAKAHDDSETNQYAAKVFEKHGIQI